MSQQDFVHLHVHTDFSLLDAAIQIKPLVKKLQEMQMKACAITDHGNLFGAFSFYHTLKAGEIQPIIGYDAYITFGSRFDRQSNLKVGERNYFHLILLAETLEGYYNLVQLSSKAYTEGFYYKPRIDLDLLAQHSSGLIALTAGLAGFPAFYLKHRKEDEALKKISELQSIIGRESVFLEIQNHDLEEENAVRQGLITLSEKTGAPLVATNEAHYLNPDDARAHDILLCIGSGKTINDPTRLTYGAPTFYLRSAAEMWQLFGKEMPAALERTLEIAERCKFDLKGGDDKDYLPRYPIPVHSGCETIDEYFEQVVYEGFNRRKESVWLKAQATGNLRYTFEVYEERIRREIEIIREMGYPGYFLIVWDFMRYAREQDIPVGPGRGSAAGSLIAYCLGITDVDPIEYDLLFERFLNPERVSMPDIDIDFCVRGREQVIKHVSQLYGSDSVCQIITFGTMASKAVIKDVGRALDMPYNEVEKIAKMIPPPVRGRNTSISQALEQVPELNEAIKRDEKVKELVDLARRLEGCARHTSIHAAGVVISPKPLHELIPVAVNQKEQQLTTQFAMADLEKTGMLKMDFLALTTLTVINDCLKFIKQTDNKHIDWQTVSLTDEKALKIFADGKTDAIFQFESAGMQDICRRLKPQGIEDLAALNALYRPGPLDGGMVDDFIARHGGKKEVRYIVPEMKEILQNTFGILVYQEQIMQLAQKLAGYSLGEADMMRRAMGKKKREEMAKHEEKFVSGAIARNIKKAKAEEIFNLMKQFADYGFNRSHSVAYAFVAFQTAYLKAHYPAHFYASVLSHEAGNSEKVYKYASEMRDINLELLPPDINESGLGFTPVKGSIRFGLSAIKGVGEGSINAIVEARREKPFTSLFDFASKVPYQSLNRRVLESLITAGAFDSLSKEGVSPMLWRPALMSAVDSALAFGQKTFQDRQRGQTGLFFGTAQNTAETVSDTEILKNAPVWTLKELGKFEKNAIGFYLTAHPLSDAHELLNELGVTTISELGARLQSSEDFKEEIWLAGIVTGFQIKVSKKGNRFCIFRLEDKTSGVKCIAWADTFQKYAHLLQEDNLILVTGRAESGEDTNITFMLDEVINLDEAKSLRADLCVISPTTSNPNESFWEKTFTTLNRHPGRCEVLFELAPNENIKIRLRPVKSLQIRGSLKLEDELKLQGCNIQWLTRRAKSPVIIPPPDYPNPISEFPPADL